MLQCVAGVKRALQSAWLVISTFMYLGLFWACMYVSFGKRDIQPYVNTAPLACMYYFGMFVGMYVGLVARHICNHICRILF